MIKLYNRQDNWTRSPEANRYAEVNFFPTMADWLDHTSYDVVKKAGATAPEGGVLVQSICHDSRWSGEGNYAKAHELARTGQSFSAVAIELREKLNRIVRVAPRQQTYLDVAGGSDFDMGSLITGVPECVFNYDEQAGRTRKTVAMFCNFGCSSGISSGEMQLRGAAYMALVDALEQSGQYKCAVYAVYGSSSYSNRGSNHQVIVRVKDCGETYDPQAVGFALTHPAMFRQLCFGYFDTLPNVRLHGNHAPSYGAVGHLSVAGLCEAIGETGEAIDFSQGLVLGEVNYGGMATAEAWLRKMLAEYNVATE